MEKEVINSWKKNASEWIKVIDSGKIISRNYTNTAILEILKGSDAHNFLDCGCGEGWLTRALTNMGKRAVGVDAIEPLIKNARQKGKEAYHVLSYENISNGSKIPGNPFDVVIFNFSLYQKKGIVNFIQSIKKAIHTKGRIIVQTLHPSFLSLRGLSYESQWIHDSWEGLPGNFTDGHKWYARTLENWHTIFRNCGLQLEILKEVTDEKKQPVSILFVLKTEL